MNLPTKYSFVAIERHIDAVAMDEYLLKSNREGVAERKIIRGTEVVQKNLNKLNKKGITMNNENQLVLDYIETDEHLEEWLTRFMVNVS